METSIFDSAFFGYKNLPDSVEVDGMKLIPIKKIKRFSAEFIRNICKILNIQLHRPVKGLICIEEQYAHFIRNVSVEDYIQTGYLTPCITNAYSEYFS